MHGDYEGAYSNGRKFIDVSSTTPDSTLAFGKAATAPTDISITRSNYRSNHDGDTLTINGTELYDYGTAVIYKATLENTAKNPMYLSQAPVVVAKFIPDGGGDAQINNNVAVSVHPTQAKAEEYTGTQSTTLAPYNLTNSSTYTPNESGGTSDYQSNYLNAGTTCDWYIKIRKVVQDSPSDETSANYVAGNAGYLEKGHFTFTVNLADSASYGDNTMRPAVWEATGRNVS